MIFFKHAWGLYIVTLYLKYSATLTHHRPRIRGTQVKSSMRMKKHRNHLNGYFGQFDSKNRVKGPELV